MIEVGLDFDNTIVNYDGVFHWAAFDQGLLKGQCETTKNAIKSSLINDQREDDWTWLQGYVYGTCMHKADLYPAALDVIKWIVDSENMNVRIISQKTMYPFAGPKHNLREAAREFISQKLQIGGNQLIPDDRIEFFDTIDEKVEAIGHHKCDIYIDDLPKIVTHEKFPSSALGVLFAPDAKVENNVGYKSVSTWLEFKEILSDYD